MIGDSSKVYKNIYKIIIINLILEFTQYVLGLGVSDITDIITNTIGVIIGICIYMVIKSFFIDKIKVKNFITICSTVAIVSVSILTIGLFIYN